MPDSQPPAAAPPIGRREIAQLPLFAGVGPDLTAALLREATVTCLAPGETLMERGSLNDHLYLVVEGELRIHLDPREPGIASLGPGDTVGEISVFDKLPTTAYVIAEHPARLLRLDERRLWRLVESSHAFARNLLVLLTGRIRNANGVVDRSLQMQRRHLRDASMDPLTGLYNRRWLNENLAAELERCRRQRQPLGLLMIDVDHFKAYNDNHGHLGGDAALRRVAAAMRECLRQRELAVRYGGEEFAVLLPEVHERELPLIAERLRQAVAQTRIRGADGTELDSVTVSIGATAMTPADDPDSLLARADRALYQAKAAGRDRVARL